MPAQQREPNTVSETNADQVTTAVAARPATAADEAVAATRKEYGTYVAKEPILFGTALGYNPGDAVGAAVVEQHGLQDRVVKAGTKAHKELRATLGLPPLEED